VATVETFGVTEAIVEAHLPMIVINSETGSLVTSARLVILLDKSAARINALVDGAFGAGTSTAIAVDTTSVEYVNCQRLVCASLIPVILRAAHHPPSISAVIQGLIADLDAQIQELIDDPARAIGRVDDPTSVSALRDRVASLGISTTDTEKKRARRQFDGRNALLGVDEGGFQF